MNSQRAAMIDAIRETPDDDDVRLVCADWFEDQGDEVSTARAEFIRTQLQIDKLALNDPRQVALQAHELRLLKQYGPAWCGAHFLFRNVRFRRGFIEYIHLHLNHYLHHRRQIAELEPIRDISFTGWYRGTEELSQRVAACKELSHLERVRIHHQGPHKHPRRNVLPLLESPNLTGLKTLDIGLVELDAVERQRWENLDILRQLQSLTMPRLETFSQTPGAWFSNGGEAPESWEKIRTLSLGHNWQDVEFLTQLMETTWWSKLEAFDFQCNWESENIVRLLATQLPNSLQALRAVGPITEGLSETVSNEFVASVAKLDLKWLGLNYFHIDPPQLQQAFTSMSSLKALSLSSCELNLEHVQVLAAGSSSKDLYHLDVSHNNLIGPDEAEALFSSDQLKSVVDLDISTTSVGSKGIKTLVASGSWNQLRLLNVANTNLKNADLVDLVAASVVENIVWITLGGAIDQADNEEPSELAHRLAALPNLAGAVVDRKGQRGEGLFEEILGDSENLAWPIVNWHGDYNTYYQQMSPSRFPPTDDAIDRHWYDIAFA